jgi:hypothetical protein
MVDRSVVVFACAIAFAMGIGMGYVIGRENMMTDYAKCRYYDQSIERCAAEVKLEKK